MLTDRQNMDNQVEANSRLFRWSFLLKFKIKGKDGKYSFLTSSTGVRSQHIHTVHCQAHLICIMIDTNSISTLNVKNF
jgi:hypothetical protein